MNVNGVNNPFNGTLAVSFSNPTPAPVFGVFNIFTASPTANQLAEVNYSINLIIPAPINSLQPLAFAISPPGQSGGSVSSFNNVVSSVAAGQSTGAPAPSAGGVSGFLLSSVGKQAFAIVSITGKTVLAPGATFEIPYLFENFSLNVGDALTVTFNGEYDVTYISG